MQYLAIGVVRETGAVLHQPIQAKGPKLALEVAKEWTRENALTLFTLYRMDKVWSHEAS